MPIASEFKRIQHRGVSVSPGYREYFVRYFDDLIPGLFVCHAIAPAPPHYTEERFLSYAAVGSDYGNVHWHRTDDGGAACLAWLARVRDYADSREESSTRADARKDWASRSRRNRAARLHQRSLNCRSC